MAFASLLLLLALPAAFADSIIRQRIFIDDFRGCGAARPRIARGSLAQRKRHSASIDRNAWTMCGDGRSELFAPLEARVPSARGACCDGDGG